jgi:hypothetical protein
MGMAQSTPARRNLAFCISQLHAVSVKGMKKLVDQFK